MGPDDSAKPDHQFPNTRWSVVLQAQGSDSELRHRALEQICCTYWLPVYAFARGQGLAPADAEDLTQNVLSELLNRKDFEKVAAGKGKLRSFLRVATKNYLRNDWKKARRLKRGGDATFLSLDYEDAEERCTLEVGQDMNPEKIFDHHWGLNLLHRTMARLEATYVGEGKGEVFAALKGVLGQNGGGPRYQDLAKSLGMSEGAIKVAVHRLRKRYRTILKQEIAHTLDDDCEEAIEEEIRDLFAIFSS
ncbi:MAG: sigma-70 family RNA polymerase sigma factor [Akkermansiaceae bacterium]|nr:sigma-70 family RNA polymerase sigma factor [Akkermansiaceae bacterium]